MNVAVDDDLSEVDQVTANKDPNYLYIKSSHT